MTYNTPDLLFVGAAESLVLESTGVSMPGIDCALDNVSGSSDRIETW
jgi:hypothetical protein